jgi:4-hydroxy-tetrahydrodipicolinate reductase
MRFAVIGTGKMGTAVAEAAIRAGHSVPVRIGGAENRSQQALTVDRLRDADVAIEFSRPETAVANLTRLVELGMPVVTGTTGWYDEIPTMQTTVRTHDGSLLYGPNFSIGAALFQATAVALAGRLAGRAEFDLVIAESHHRQKRDAPSGTAKALRDALRAVLPARELAIVSTRLGWIPGTHSVLADARSESIELTHTVRDRAVFAEGAVLAAEWLRGRKGFHHFHDVLEGETR